MKVLSILSSVIMITIFTPLCNAEDNNKFKNALNNETCKKFRLNTATIVKMRNDGMPQVMVSKIVGGGIPNTDPTKKHLANISSDVYKFSSLNIHSHSMYQYLSCARKLEGKTIKPLNTYNVDLLKCQKLTAVKAQISCIAGVIDN